MMLAAAQIPRNMALALTLALACGVQAGEVNSTRHADSISRASHLSHLSHLSLEITSR